MENVDLLAFEKELYKQNIALIAGVDEVGRGPLAGPVVAAAVILPKNVELTGVNDSKKLSAKKRVLYYNKILETAIAVGVGKASVREIDEINILQATKLAMKRAIDHLSIIPEYLLIDYLTLDLEIPQTGIVKGDARSLSIAAASIVAKEVRDKLMKELGEKYPTYGFKTNAGYGTSAHREALKAHGYIEGVHRKSFEPVKSIVAAQKQRGLF
jgi:ribonuclease HII